MALSGLYIGIDTILEKLFRDYGFEDQVTKDDAAEWAGEALALIGAMPHYEPRITDGDENRDHPEPIKITNYRGSLPCDLHKIVQTREFCSGIPMIYSTSSFNDGNHINNSPDLTCTTGSCRDKDVDEVTSTAQDDNTSCNPFFNFNPNPTQGTAYAANLPSNTYVDFPTNLTYKITKNHIFTSFKEGYVEMAYWAYPLDSEGYPLIPTEERYRKAVTNYLAHRISFKLWVADKMSRDKKEEFESEWLFYVQGAANEANMPDIDKMEALKNQWLRMIPNVDEHISGFKYLGEAERRIVHNARP